jgi:hypothetical protein
MEKTYVFRIILDTKEDVFRDIELVGTQTLIDLHQAVLTSFGIAPGEMASFYASDDEWNQGDEVPMEDMGLATLTMGTMNMVTIQEWVEIVGKRSLYVYDFLLFWTFFVELISTNEVDLSTNVTNVISDYPRVLYVYGRNPKHAPSKNFGEEQDTKGTGLFESAFDEEDEDGQDFDDDEINDYQQW